jgi:two-component system KDP operon response regulator KdpE
MKSSVLVVDDDLQAAKVLRNLLWSGGYEVQTTTDGDAALAALRTWSPSAIIADLQMARLDGVELCRRIRKTSNVPIIVMTGDVDEVSEVMALDAGADDFLAKSIASETLLARLRAALRRSTTSADAPAIALGDFVLDFHERRVKHHGQSIRLTPKEFDLFAYMAKHPNRVLHHKTLLGAVWGESAENQPEYLRVFVGQLRKKLETDPPNPRYVVTEPWVGYRFNPTGLVQ